MVFDVSYEGMNFKQSTTVRLETPLYHCTADMHKICQKMHTECQH